MVPDVMESDIIYMRLALEEAKAAAARDEVPIGAVLVDIRTGTVAARAGNRTIELRDPSGHAEVLVIRDVCGQAGAQRIPEYDLFVTLEPCAMCAAVISFARVRRLVFGAGDPKGGGVVHGGKFYEQPTCHHRPEVTEPVMVEECGDVLKSYFKGKRVKTL
ncbi:MAG: nucleoside deaminase [Alphaproteobacteria bacterium]